MSDRGQKLTRQVYENPDVVAGYIKEHAISPKIPQSERQKFVASLPGHRLLDLGCGPGHDSYAFAELGCSVTGVDLSSTMIKAAKNFKLDAIAQPTFVVGNMLDLSIFRGESFDGIWACASLVHLPIIDLPQALGEMHRVLIPGGKAFISVKGGDQTERLIEEDKYGPKMSREFTFWDGDFFASQLQKAGFSIDQKGVDTVSNRQGVSQTTWLNFWATRT